MYIYRKNITRGLTIRNFIPLQKVFWTQTVKRLGWREDTLRSDVKKLALEYVANGTFPIADN